MFQGWWKRSPLCMQRKGGLEWSACCSDAGSDKTVPCDATVSRNAKGRVFLGTSLWPLTQHLCQQHAHNNASHCRVAIKQITLVEKNVKRWEVSVTKFKNFIDISAVQPIKMTCVKRVWALLVCFSYLTLDRSTYCAHTQRDAHTYRRDNSFGMFCQTFNRD